LIFSQLLLPEGEGGRRPDEGATVPINATYPPSPSGKRDIFDFTRDPYLYFFSAFGNVPNV